MIEALDRLYHWLCLKAHRELWFPGANWLCDRHEHNVTGMSMAELRRERLAGVTDTDTKDETTNGIQITPRNDRGFSQYGEPVATDYGHKVEVFESSSAEAAKCWLRIYDDGQVAIDHHKGLSVSAHLTVDQAIAIRERLSTFIYEAVGVSDTNQEKPAK